MEHDTGAQAEAHAPDPPTTASQEEGGASGVTTTTPRRRRHRGGRGRGGRGKGSGQSTGADVGREGATPPAAETSEEQPGPSAGAPGASKPRAPRARKPAAPKAATAEKAPTQKAAATETGGETEGAPKPAARRRRRRGGRGRGGRAVAAQAVAPDVADAEMASAADEEEAAQREEALPDEAAPTTSRRRRPARPRAARPKAEAADKPAGEVAAEVSGPPDEPKRAPRPRTTRRSAEEAVAAGGPTRLRSSRSRTGGTARTVSRRRREPFPVVPRVTDKLMVITEHSERDQIAVLEGRDLVQHYVTRIGATSMVGNVYLGRVQNVLPGMEAAFVDIGRGRNGVLYAGEVNYSPEDLEGSAPRIEQVLKSGQALLVQVTKDPMGGKGARLTAQISMPGRYLVMVPNADVSGISRRLPDDERRRLKAIMRKIKPDAHGIIVRTAAEGASEEALTADLDRLVREWDGIVKVSKKVKAPAVLYEEPELTVRVVRDLFTDEEFRGLVTDSARVHGQVMEYVNGVAPDLAPKIRLHEGKLPAFEEFHIVEQIHKALDRKVWLPSGGYLIIERTEAMTIVDVNTGKSVGKTNLEETVVNTNLEAARETAKQLRLRDIGGIIVVDFIDMLLEQNKRKVEDTMKEALAIDKTRSQVFEIGPLGLMQVTRKRVSSGLVESFSETCPTCEGRGILLNYEA